MPNLLRIGTADAVWPPLLAVLLLVQAILWGSEAYFAQFIFFVASYLSVLYRSWFCYGFLNPVVLFLISTFLYLAAGATDLHLFSNEDSLSENNIGLLLLFGCFFVSVLLLFYDFFYRNNWSLLRLSRLDRMIEGGSFVRIIRLLSGFGIIVLVPVYIGAFVGLYGFGIGYISRGDIYSESSYLLVALRIVLPLLAVVYVWASHVFESKSSGGFNYLVLLVVLLWVLFDLLLKGDRRVLVSVILGVVCIKYFGRKLPFYYVALGGAAAIVLYLYGAVRNRPLDVWLDNINYSLTSQFSPSKTEFGPFSIVANELMRADLFFSDTTVFNGFLSALPTFVYPDRPLASSVKFVKEYFPDFYDIGGGLAFNIIVDAALMFGFFAPVLLGFFYALLFSFGNQRGKTALLMNGVLVYALTFTARFDFASMFQTLFYICFVLFAGYGVVLLLMGRNRAKSI